MTENPEEIMLKTRYLMQFSDGSAWAIPMSMLLLAVASKNDEDPQERVYQTAVVFSKLAAKKFDVFMDELVKTNLVWDDVKDSATQVFTPVTVNHSVEFLDCKSMVR